MLIIRGNCSIVITRVSLPTWREDYDTSTLSEAEKKLRQPNPPIPTRQFSPIPRKNVLPRFSCHFWRGTWGYINKVKKKLRILHLFLIFFFVTLVCVLWQKLKVSKWTRRRVPLQDKVVRASHCGKCKHKTIEQHFACLWRSSGTLGRYRSSVIFVAFVWLTACHLGANCALTKLIARIFVTFLVQTATFKLKDLPLKGRVINWVNLASEYGVGDWRVCAFNCF